jgi:PAS domain-containing protein
MKDVRLVQDADALLVSQQSFQITLDALSAHISILDGDGNILYVNTGWRDFADANQLGYENHGVDINYLEICDSAAGDWAQGADEAAAGIRKVLSGEIEEFSMSYPCPGPQKQRWFDMRAVPLKDHSRSGAIIFHEDVSERKQIEASLIERDRKYQAIFENAAAAIFLMTGDRFVDCNLST